MKFLITHTEKTHSMIETTIQRFHGTA